MERAPYVHFEGLDLAGKSTLSKKFRAATGGEWNVQRNRINSVNHIQPLADKIRIEELYDDEVIGTLYYAALLGDIRTFAWPEMPTIQDSTIVLRSFAFHSVARTPRLPSLFKDILDEHPKFDMSVLLTASIDKRKERLKIRMVEHPEVVSKDDTMILSDPNRFLDMEAFIIENAKRVFGSTVVDTTNMTEDQVLNIALKEYEGLKR